jgi:hypothetical protein
LEAVQYGEVTATPPSLLRGRGQKGVVAVYLINNGRSSSRRIVWHGCSVEHPYHAFGRDY